MRHLSKIAPGVKLNRWLELCDLAFEFSKATLSADPVIAERKALRNLAARLNEKRKYRRLILSRMP